MWLIKTTSGKIARQPNLDRFRREVPQVAGLPLPAWTARASVAETVAWALALAVALYLLLALQPNLSWGIYAGF
jgi:hypothetical protein